MRAVDLRIQHGDKRHGFLLLLPTTVAYATQKTEGFTVIARETLEAAAEAAFNEFAQFEYCPISNSSRHYHFAGRAELLVGNGMEIYGYRSRVLTDADGPALQLIVKDYTEGFDDEVVLQGDDGESETRPAKVVHSARLEEGEFRILVTGDFDMEDIHVFLRVVNATLEGSQGVADAKELVGTGSAA